MLCDFEWPYGGRDSPRDINWDLEQARKELNIMTARCCRLAGILEQCGIIPSEDGDWWLKHKEYDNKKKAKNARKTRLDHPRC